MNASFNWKSAHKSRKEDQGIDKLEMTKPRSGQAHENAVNHVERLLAGVDDDIAKIVMLHADSGYSYAEIAAMMGHSRSKVASILSWARQKLRESRRGGRDRPRSTNLIGRSLKKREAQAR